MQINANYSVNGVPYDNKRKQNNIPQFSTECAVQENENINPYMAEADFDEKAFGMILLRMKECAPAIRISTHSTAVLPPKSSRATGIANIAIPTPNHPICVKLVSAEEI